MKNNVKIMLMLIRITPVVDQIMIVFTRKIDYPRNQNLRERQENGKSWKF